MKQRFLLLLLALLLTALFLTQARQQPVAADNGGYLHTSGNLILNDQNEVVRITGVNWFGFETGNNVAHGLWARNWESMLDQMAGLGYNTVRLPFSNEVLEPGKMPDSIDPNKNPDLVGLSSIEIMDKIIDGARQRGLKVILDNHRSNAGVSAQESGLWYTADYPHERWIADWEFLVDRYKDDDTVVGVDLRNEPHDAACWGCGDPALDWQMAATEAGNAVLAIHPDLLIFVEGVECYNPNGSTDPYEEGTECTWWGGNLMGVQDHPITLDVPNRLVYSPHEYPASVYPQPWFSDPTYPDNMPGIWQQFWGYIHEQDIAPLMFGEFGTRYVDEVDVIWFDTFVEYMTSNGMHGTYWSWNPNSGDTGGLLQDDWTTIHQDKQAVLDPWLAPTLGDVPTPTPTSTGGGGSAPLELQYAVGDSAASDNQIKPHLQLVNTGSSATSLDNITVRYWLTRDGNATVNVYCDYAVIGCANISGSFVPLSTPVDGADGYVEFSFADGVAIPAHGNSGIMQLRLAKSDWSNFNEADDYSYDGAQTELADYANITVYAGGALVWGVEPGGTTVTPTFTPTATATETPTETPTVSTTPTETPSLTPTDDDITPSPTPTCPAPNTATPEPFIIDPVTSPTDELTQTITVYLNSESVTAVGPAGTVVDTEWPFELEVPLLPNAVNEIEITGLVREVYDSNGCLIGGGYYVGRRVTIVQQSAPDIACTVAYAVNDDWGSGFVANVTITNEGATAVNGWRLDYDFPGNQTIVDLWGGSYTQTGQSVSVTDAGWNSDIPPNGSVSFGFKATYSISNNNPTTFALNGNPCNQ